MPYVVFGAVAPLQQLRRGRDTAQGADLGRVGGAGRELRDHGCAGRGEAHSGTAAQAEAHGTDDRGLARTVRADDQVEARVRVDLPRRTKYVKISRNISKYL
eukprot:SAG31_NODE_206_length_20335_cov_17.910160_22_plen_102_part_00